MGPAGWAALSAIVGPSLLFVTYLASRPSLRRQADTDRMSATVTSALSTTEIMQGLLAPMEAEIRELRTEVKTLREHIQTLEGQIKALGVDPVPFGRGSE